MKLALAAACLAATLSLAPAALADGRTTVTLQQPVSGKIQFIVYDAIWDCAGTTCVAGATPDGSFGVGQCHAVARKAGAVAQFSNEYNKTLPADLIEKCNTGLAPKPAVTAAR